MGIGTWAIGVDFMVGPLNGIDYMEVPFSVFGLPIGSGAVQDTFMVE